MKISEQYAECRRELAKLKRRYDGLTFREEGFKFASREVEHFPPGSRDAKEALANLDKQPTEAFRVYRNAAGGVTVEQVTWLPSFHLT